MPIHFSRSMRRVEAEGSWHSLLFLTATLIFIALWASWAFRARVSVYASTGVARLEVAEENHPVATPVSGRVTAVSMVAGHRVHAGDVLLELDANPERLERTEVLAKLVPTAAQLRSLRDELSTQELAIEVERRSAEAARNEATAKSDEAEAAADLANDEARRLADLKSKGLVSSLDALRGEKQALEKVSEARATQAAAQRTARDLAAKEQDRLARVARLRNEIAEIEAGRSEAFAASERLDYQIGQRQVRAPVAGTLAEVAPLKLSAMLQAGDRICTIVPDGGLKVVAMFRPSVALGRVRNGQPARVRLEGFPWTQYGSAQATVTQVSGEVRDGQIRVDLALNASPDSAIPFQHGLPAEVQVEVERISPAVLLLRSAGRQLRADAATTDQR